MGGTDREALRGRGDVVQRGVDADDVLLLDFAQRPHVDAADDDFAGGLLDLDEQLRAQLAEVGLDRACEREPVLREPRGPCGLAEFRDDLVELHVALPAVSSP